MVKNTAKVLVVLLVLGALAKAFLVPEPTARSYARFLVKMIDATGIDARLRSSEVGCARLKHIDDDSRDQSPPGQFVRCIAGSEPKWERP